MVYTLYTSRRCSDIKTSRSSTHNFSKICANFLSSCYHGFYHVPRLKAKELFLSSQISPWKAGSIDICTAMLPSACSSNNMHYVSSKVQPFRSAFAYTTGIVIVILRNVPLIPVVACQTSRTTFHRQTKTSQDFQDLPTGGRNHCRILQRSPGLFLYFWMSIFLGSHIVFFLIAFMTRPGKVAYAVRATSRFWDDMLYLELASLPLLYTTITAPMIELLCQILTNLVSSKLSLLILDA